MGTMQIYEDIRIERLAFGGDGIGHLPDGRVVFVALTCPGDTVDVRALVEKDSFVRGRIERLVRPGAKRVAPACAHAADGTCAGCPWAHISYETQLAWKRQSLVDALGRIAGLDASRISQVVQPIVPSAREWGYRNKVEFACGADARGKHALGMHDADGAFHAVDACLLAPERFRGAPKALTGAMRYALGETFASIERVGLRVAATTGDVELAIWSPPGRFPRKLAAQVAKDALGAKGAGVVRVLLKGTPKQRKTSGVEVLAGRGCWREKLAGRELKLSAPSFFQVNTKGAEQLVRLAMEGIEPSGIDVVADLYCGAGAFTLPLADAALLVHAVEMEGSSVRDLRRNLSDNGLSAHVVGGDVARELPSLGRLDKAVVDPPRGGLDASVVDTLAASGASRIVYVSCNPTTFARDAKRLEGLGLRLVKATPVDLFPQTYHVETVALFTRA